MIFVFWSMARISVRLEVNRKPRHAPQVCEPIFFETRLGKKDKQTDMAHTSAPRAALIAPFLLMASTCGLIASALSISSLPGLGYDPVSILGMAQLAFITGVIIVAAIRGHTSPRTEILCGSILALTALLHTGLYVQSGPGHPVAESLELLYFWGLAAGSLALLARAALRRSGIHDAFFGVAGLAVVLLQLPAHSIFAGPAAEAVYSHPHQIAASIDYQTDLEAAGLTPYTPGLPGIIRPEDITTAITRLENTNHEVRHSWLMPNPLPNLPRAELLVVYDGLSSKPGAWVLAPGDMATPGIPLILLHYVFTAVSVLLLIGPALFLRHRKKFSSLASRSSQTNASHL